VLASAKKQHIESGTISIQQPNSRTLTGSSWWPRRPTGSWQWQLLEIHDV